MRETRFKTMNIYRLFHFYKTKTQVCFDRNQNYIYVAQELYDDVSNHYEDTTCHFCEMKKH